MPSAMPAIDWEQEQRQEWETPQDQEAAPAETQRSARLVEIHSEELEAEIERARGLAGGEIDGETVYSVGTLDRAVVFLKMHVEWLWQTCGIKAPVPMIGPGPAGSVDLFWQRRFWKLLVNIPAAEDAFATFYGDDYGPQKTKGTIDPNKVSISVAACLMV